MASSAEYRERHRQSIRKWNTEHPERHRERERLRKPARKKAKRAFIFARDAGICYLCGFSVDPRNFHIDHVIPVSKSGSNALDNLKVSHPACNMSKGDKILEEAN